MAKNLHHILARMQKPLLLEPNYASILFSAILPRLGIDELVTVDGQKINVENAKQVAGTYDKKGIYRPYQVVDGVAVVPITGSLYHKYGELEPYSGATGYDGIQRSMQIAIDDPEVKGILLDMDTPGGEVAGVSTAGEFIKNSPKPVWAHANEMAASAGYWLASQAEKIIVSDSAQVGSIGVLVAHKDMSQALDKQGIKVTLIHAGAHKVDGNPYEALSKEIKADIQAEIDTTRTRFASTVASGRKMSLEAVMNTEARMYTGQKAVEIGLADKVASFDATLKEFSKSLAGVKSTPLNKGMKMEDNAVPVQAGFTQAQLDTARAEATVAERNRISAILNHPNAVGREKTASKLAFKPSMDVETAADILADVPVDTAHAQAPQAPKAPVVNTDRLNALADHQPINNKSAETEKPLSEEEKAMLLAEQAFLDMGVTLKGAK